MVWNFANVKLSQEALHLSLKEKVIKALVTKLFYVGGSIEVTRCDLFTQVHAQSLRIGKSEKVVLDSYQGLTAADQDVPSAFKVDQIRFQNKNVSFETKRDRHQEISRRSMGVWHGSSAWAHISWQISITLEVGKKSLHWWNWKSSALRRGRRRNEGGRVVAAGIAPNGPEKEFEPFAAFSYQRITTFRGFAILVVTFYEGRDFVWVLKCVNVLPVRVRVGMCEWMRCLFDCKCVCAWIQLWVKACVGKCVWG